MGGLTSFRRNVQMKENENQWSYLLTIFRHFQRPNRNIVDSHPSCKHLKRIKMRTRMCVWVCVFTCVRVRECVCVCVCNVSVCVCEWDEDVEREREREEGGWYRGNDLLAVGVNFSALNSIQWKLDKLFAVVAYL